MDQIRNTTATVTTPQEMVAEGAKRVSTSRIGRWGAKLGFAAFMFFLIKGLLWLIIPAGIAAVAFIRG